MRLIKLAAAAAAVLMLFANTAIATEAGDWIIRAGATHIAPKSDNGYVEALEVDLDVGSATMLTFDGTYMITNHFGVELLAALPFKHDVYLKAGGEKAKVASVKHLPPTLSAVYRFNPSGQFQPYVGAGVNWTIFFSEKERSVLEDLDVNLKLDDSWGLAAVVGVDVALTERMFLNGNIRYMDIDSDVKVSGLGKIATAKVDPWIYSINIGWRI